MFAETLLSLLIKTKTIFTQYDIFLCVVLKHLSKETEGNHPNVM